MTYVVSVSGGLTSFEALRRTIIQKGIKNTVAVFADTKQEDGTLYKFLEDQEKLFGIEIIRLREGRTPFQVMKDERAISLQSAVPCSKILKQKLIRKWYDENYPNGIMVSGLDWTELPRIERFLKRYPLSWFPLIEKPLLIKEDIKAYLEQMHIELPLLYKLGFKHNNCGGGCVKAGQAHWKLLLEKLPDRYRAWEVHEQEMRSLLGKNIAYMTEQRNKRKYPLTLRTFRLRMRKGKDCNIYDYGGCGCFQD